MRIRNNEIIIMHNFIIKFNHFIVSINKLNFSPLALDVWVYVICEKLKNLMGLKHQQSAECSDNMPDADNRQQASHIYHYILIDPITIRLFRNLIFNILAIFRTNHSLKTDHSLKFHGKFLKCKNHRIIKHSLPSGIIYK